MPDTFDGGNGNGDRRLADLDVRLLAYLFDRGLVAVALVPMVLMLTVAPSEPSSIELLPTGTLPQWSRTSVWP